MLTPQSIIVYRNPAEAALWESGMVFPIIVGAVISLASVLIVLSVLQMLSKRFDIIDKLDPSIVAIVVAILSMLYTVHKFGGI